MDNGGHKDEGIAYLHIFHLSGILELPDPRPIQPDASLGVDPEYRLQLRTLHRPQIQLHIVYCEQQE